MLLFLLKSIGGPGSIRLLILIVAVGVLFHYWKPSCRRIVRRGIAIAVVAYGVMALPVVATMIANQLPLVVTSALTSLGRLDALLIIDGDNRLGRARTSAAIVVEHSPTRVLLFGDEAMRDLLVEAGIPENRIELDESGSNTRLQVAAVTRLYAARPLKTALVASRLQMPRIASLVREHPFDVLLISSPADREPPTGGGLSQFLPRLGALNLTRDAIYEHVALMYYRWRGWIGRTNGIRKSTNLVLEGFLTGVHSNASASQMTSVISGRDLGLNGPSALAPACAW